MTEEIQDQIQKLARTEQEERTMELNTQVIARGHGIPNTQVVEDQLGNHCSTTSIKRHSLKRTFNIVTNVFENMLVTPLLFFVRPTSYMYLPTISNCST